MTTATQGRPTPRSDAAAPAGSGWGPLHRFALASAGALDVEGLWDAAAPLLPSVSGAAFAAMAAGGGDPDPRTWARQGLDGPVTAAAVDAARASAGIRHAASISVRAAGQAHPAVAAPLRPESDEPGVLVLGWKDDPPDDAVERTAILAEQLGSGLAHVRLYDELREAALRRERFFSAMSHDLRTPVTAIVGYGELLHDGIVGELNDEQRKMVARISEVAEHLSHLVNDILDLARLEAGRMQMHQETVELGDIVDEALMAVAPQAMSRRLKVRAEIDAHRTTPVRVDPPRARQVLVNLLSNAVKFTEAGTVAVLAGTDGTRSWIEVRDTGPGLPPGAEETVFEEFLRAAAGTRARTEPGSGLGLAVSRRLARAMGGDLVAANRPEGGASFVLYLPLDGN